MNFQNLILEIKKIQLREIRTNTGDYFEAVVPKDRLSELEKLLAVHFGLPVKPAGVFATGEVNKYSRPYGGVRYEQTMYLKRLEQGLEFAFLWPWGCGTLVTLKIINDNGQPVDPGNGGGLVSWVKSIFWK